MAKSEFTTKSFWEALPPEHFRPRNIHLECWLLYDTWRDLASEWLQECQAFDDWVPYGWGDKIFEKRWSCFPTDKKLPIINEWFKLHPQYYKPEVMKLDPGGVIPPHSHDYKPDDPDWLYNMALNYPDGCKFGVYPCGIIPYKPGEIYKLKVYNDHCVVNNSNEIRYHIVFKQGIDDAITVS
tara:strand:+ start:5060 stop:5605 length:546 start_codon:yes stop_codon:yes gene_type:complete